ncbi:uncharacterized protein TNCV_1839351 [Trichonephila clavipes]|nr:uncharacterized protein TNCV_1839351 [Trichonephila clavipes]
MANVEFETVTSIVAGLKPVKIGLEKLCSRNATLLTAEVREAEMERELGTKRFCEEEVFISNSSHSEEKSMEILKEKPLTSDEKLEKAIYSKSKVLYCSVKKSTSFNKIMKQEMQLFDSTENPLPNIIKLCEALKTIPPTSVEAKRAFSAAGLFVKKLRARLRNDNYIPGNGKIREIGNPSPQPPGYGPMPVSGSNGSGEKQLQRSCRSPKQTRNGGIRAG